MTVKITKPIFQSDLYSVWKHGASFIVTLSSDKSKVQYSGTKEWCLSWARENSGMGDV